MSSQQKHYREIYETLKNESNQLNKNQKKQQILHSQLLQHYQDQLVRKPIDQRRMQFKTFVAQRSQKQKISSQLQIQHNNKDLLAKIDKLKKQRQMLQAQSAGKKIFLTNCEAQRMKKYYQDHLIDSSQKENNFNKNQRQTLRQITKEKHDENNKYKQFINKQNKNFGVEQILTSNYDENQRIAQRIRNKWMNHQQKQTKIKQNNYINQMYQKPSKFLQQNNLLAKRNQYNNQNKRSLFQNQQQNLNQGRNSKMQYLKNYQSLGNYNGKQTGLQYPIGNEFTKNQKNIIKDYQQKQPKVKFIQETKTKTNVRKPQKKQQKKLNENQKIIKNNYTQKKSYKRMDLDELLRDYTTKYPLQNMSNQRRLSQNNIFQPSSPHFYEQNKFDKQHKQIKNNLPLRLINWNKSIHSKNNSQLVYQDKLKQNWIQKIKKRIQVSKQIFIDSEYKNKSHEIAHLENTYNCQITARQQLKNKICTAAKKHNKHNYCKSVNYY